MRIRIEAVNLDSTIVKVHPDGTGLKKNASQSIGKSRAAWTTKIHMVAAHADKLDVMFMAYLCSALVVEALR